MVYITCTNFDHKLSLKCNTERKLYCYSSILIYMYRIVLNLIIFTGSYSAKKKWANDNKMSKKSNIQFNHLYMYHRA